MSSLFLTLIVVPVIYQIVDKMLHKFGMDKPPLPIEELVAEPYDHKDVHEY